MIKNKRYASFILIIITILLLSNSCTTKIVKTFENKKRLEVMIEKIKKYNEDIKSFKGDGYAILKTDGNTKTFRIEMIFSNNFNSYQFLIKDFVFQKPIAILVKKEKEPIILYDYIKRVKNSYPDTTEIFKKILNFELPEGNIFIQSLGLRVPIINSTPGLIDDNTVEFSFEDSKEVIYFTGEYPEKINFFNNGTTMTIKYDKITSKNDKPLPSRILIKINDTSLEINYKNISINGDYKAAIKLIK